MTDGSEGRDYTVDSEFKDKSGVSINETERLLFAKQLLVVIAIISVAAGVSFAYNPENKRR